MSVLPKITSIDQADIAPRYVWVDEDGHQVSAVMREFGRALNFIQSWQARWDKLQRSIEEGRKVYGHGADVAAMTRSGKPPITLKKIVVSIEIVDLEGDEQTVATAISRLP